MGALRRIKKQITENHKLGHVVGLRPDYFTHDFSGEKRSTQIVTCAQRKGKGPLFFDEVGSISKKVFDSLGVR